MDFIRLLNFRKAYKSWFGKPYVAVDNISFGLNFGECFALLGVNGAGKSTTFKSLSRDITPTSGSVTVAGFDIVNEFSEARKLIGYCPQYNAIFDLLTVEDNLQFFAAIKGVPPNKLAQVINYTIK